MSAAPCTASCPLGIDIPQILAHLERDERNQAVELLVQQNPFADLCGQLCRAGCQQSCRRKLIDHPIHFSEIERSLAEEWRISGRPLYRKEETNLAKVRVVGSGMRALAAAIHLGQLGIPTELFLNKESFAGIFSILPRFALSESWESEFRKLLDRIKINVNEDLQVSRTTIQEWSNEEASHTLVVPDPPRSIQPSSQIFATPSVFPALKVLKDLKDGKEFQLGKRVAILGGSSFAFAVAQLAKRMGADWVELYCEHSRLELTASSAEIEAAHEFGIRINYFYRLNRSVLNRDEITGNSSLQIRLRKLRQTSIDGSLRLVPSDDRTLDLEVDSLIHAELGSHAMMGPDGKAEQDPLYTGFARDKGVWSDSNNRIWFLPPENTQDGDFPNLIDELSRGKHVAGKLLEYLWMGEKKEAKEKGLEILPEASRITPRRRPRPAIVAISRLADPLDPATGFLNMSESKSLADSCLRCSTSVDLKSKIDQCIGCNLCIDLCPKQCIEAVPVENPPASFPSLVPPLLQKLFHFREDLGPATVATIPAFADQSQCIQCMACVNQCPSDAIALSS